MGMFHSPPPPDPPHPRPEPRCPGPLTGEALDGVFANCVDYGRRWVDLGGDPGRRLELVYLAGMVRMERVSDYVLRPLAVDAALAGAAPEDAWDRMAHGALYNLTAAEKTTLDQAVSDLISGNCLLLHPAGGRALSFNTGTEEKRSISPPENEVSIKGAQDAFVENLRTNTSLTRRHLRAPELKLEEQVVGRQSLTPVDLLWVEGIADPATVAAVRQRVEAIDIDALEATGNLEEYLVDDLHTAFPLVRYTQRPDQFSAGLAQGRVGLLIEGIPLGYLAPAVLGDFIKAPQDKSENWVVASVLTVLRWLCLLVTLYLPGLYVAMVTFHPEMIPTRLALSIIAAKRDVPFSTVFEVLLMLLAFEVLQEAGLRLPKSIGQTVSILGGLVVGSAAVEARLVSPAVLVVVAVAGIAGYTMPSQDLAGALRLWRFLLAVSAAVAGLFGVTACTAALVIHLAGLESFGVSYLTPFAANAGEGAGDLIRQPLPNDKYRPSFLKGANRRQQR